MNDPPDGPVIGLSGSHRASPDLSSGLMPAAGVRLAGFWSWISGLGYDGSPAVGPGSQGSTAPGGFLPARWDGFALVRAGAGWRGCAARR